MCLYHSLPHKCHNSETWNMLNIGNYEMHIPPSQKHTVHCIELGILRAVAYLSSLHIYPYLSSLHPQESSKMPKKNIKHMKISQHQGRISIQTFPHSLPKWNITYKCVQLIFYVDHTLLWQHITALNQIARVHWSVSEHNVIDAFVKRLRAQLEEVGVLGKCDYHATVSKVKWWVRQCCSSWKKEYKERKERKYTLPAITLSDSGEKHSRSVPRKGNNYIFTVYLSFAFVT